MKFERYGIRSTASQPLKFYLRNRSQKVSINQSISPKVYFTKKSYKELMALVTLYTPFNSRSTQGSILGRWLFSIHLLYYNWTRDLNQIFKRAYNEKLDFSIRINQLLKKLSRLVSYTNGHLRIIYLIQPCVLFIASSFNHCWFLPSLSGVLHSLLLQISCK